MMVCVLRYAQSIFTGAYALETAEVFFFLFFFFLAFLTSVVAKASKLMQGFSSR